MLGGPVVRIEDLRVSLEGREVIPPTSLEVRCGERLCIVGPPGSGKSLLLELMAGRPVPHQGHLSYPAWIVESPDAAIGVPPRFAVHLISTSEQRRLVSQYASFHQARWHASFSTPYTVDFFLSVRGAYGLREFEECPAELEFARHEAHRTRLVSDLGLEYLLGRQLSALSNGEWRKLLLVRALLARPRLLLLDDPLGGVDPDSRQRVLDVLTDYCRREHNFARVSRSGVDAEEATDERARGLVTLVFTTPRPDELSPLTTRMVELDTTTASVPRRPKAGVPEPHAKPPAAPPEYGSVVLRLRNASVRCGASALLDQVSLEVIYGQHWLITGPNGAGKSTLLALLLGDHPQSYVADLEVLGLRARPGVTLFERQRRIGYMAPELATHYPSSWSVGDVVLSGLNASIGLFVAATPADRALADCWIERFDLAAMSNRALAGLSEVEMRKVFLARALVRAPALLVLDEPTQGLTALESAEMLQVIDSVVARINPTLLMVSHHELERPRCITHHLVLNLGRVVHSGRAGDG